MADTRPKTSFIPKKEGSYKPSVRGLRRDRFDPISTIFILMFILTLVAWGGVIFYKGFINSQIADRKKELAEKRVVLQGGDKLDRIFAADKRFTVIKTLLSQHIVPSTLFDTLDQRTVEGLRFTSFGYTGAPEDKALVTVKGEAHNFSTAVTQSDVIDALPEVEVISVTEADQRSSAPSSRSGRSVTDEHVIFELEFTIPMSHLRYKDVYMDYVSTSTDEEASVSVTAGADDISES